LELNLPISDLELPSVVQKELLAEEGVLRAGPGRVAFGQKDEQSEGEPVTEPGGR
jgi:hypothetical protein